MVFRSLLSVLLGLLILPPAFSDEPIEFGKFRQLFLDDHVIASRSHIRRTLHQATPYGGNPVIEANKPWESGLAYHYGSVEWHLDRQSAARESTNGRTGSGEMEARVEYVVSCLSCRCHEGPVPNVEMTVK